MYVIKQPEEEEYAKHRKEGFCKGPCASASLALLKKPNTQ